jgi:ribosome-binding factor A
MPREFSRNQRLGSQMLRTLNELVRFESKDPRLDGVSLTAIDLSRDLSVARVFFSQMDPNAEPSVAAEGLARAAGFLRSRLGSSLKVRKVPELRFVHDDSIVQGAEISRLIDIANSPGDSDSQG